MVIDNLGWQCWRQVDAVKALVALTDYAKEDSEDESWLSSKSPRWYATVSGSEFETLCTSKKFWDMRAERSGDGAIDWLVKQGGQRRDFA